MKARTLTVSELAAVGLGSILVPYPHAVDDHQTQNAAFLEQAGAALCLSDITLTAAPLAEGLRRLGLDRDALLQRAAVEKLPHRSDECSPCTNANRADLRRLSGRQIGKLAALETETGQPMFRAAKHAGAQGIEQVIHWAKYSPGQYKPGMDDLFTAGCGSPFGCGL